MNKLYFAEDSDTTPDHADNLEEVLFEVGLEYLVENTSNIPEFE